MAERGPIKRGRDFDDDPFENFQCDPPRPNGGAFQSFSRRSKYSRGMAAMGSLSGSRDWSQFGSNTSLSALSGSTQNLLLDRSKMMSMQEDAHSRRITSEVMKHRLYESVIISPRRRRLSMMSSSGSGGDHLDPGYAAAATSRMAMSMPVTPAHSQNVTPSHSPTSNKRFTWGWFSRGTTPRSGTTPTEEEGIMEVEEDSWKGLASLFKPQPKYIPAGRWSRTVETEAEQMDIEGRRTSSPTSDGDGLFLRDVPKRQKRSPSPIADEED